MKKIAKKSIKKFLRIAGLRVLKESNYRKLIIKAELRPSVYNKNSLLETFFQLLRDQGFHPNVIYDIGANRGRWTQLCLRYFPQASYYLFEPQETLHSDIKKNLAAHKDFQIFKVGVGNTNGELSFTIHNRDDSCSFSYSKEEAILKGFDQTKIEVVRLEDFIKKNNLQPPVLIKVDAEGLDMDVLEGAAKILSKTEVILVEVGVMNKRISNSALNVMNYMDAFGYRLFDITDINRPFPNQILWLCEYVFIKKDGFLDKNYSTN